MNKKECPSCAMEVPENSEECPVCGFEFPAVGKKRSYILILLLLLFVIASVIAWVKRVL